LARGLANWEQRQELHHILHWTRQPVKTQMQAMVQYAVRDFLDGVDPSIRFEQMGLERFVYIRAIEKARVFLGNERGKRRNRAKEILAERARNSRSFTTENFHVTMDYSQHRDYGMINASIYCMVEVWLNEDEVEREYLVNYSDFKTKEWLTKLLVWALMNQREVLLKPATEAEIASVRMFVPEEDAATLDVATDAVENGGLDETLQSALDESLSQEQVPNEETEVEDPFDLVELAKKIGEDYSKFRKIKRDLLARKAELLAKVTLIENQVAIVDRKITIAVETARILHMPAKGQ